MTDNFRVKCVGNWLYIKHKDTPETLRHFSGMVQADYYLNDFSAGVFSRTKNKSLNYNLMYITEPAQYGCYIGWSHSGWQLEGGWKNPFSKHDQKESSMNRGVYSYQNVATGKLYQQSGYVKVTYTFDFGRKTSRANNEINTNMNSTILKLD